MDVDYEQQNLDILHSLHKRKPWINDKEGL
jgi:hypothetical protein